MKTSNSLPDHVETALKDYFQSQVPTPWPECPTSARVTLARTGSPPIDTFGNSRAALAVSVVLLVGLGWIFTSGTSPSGSSSPRNTLTNGATADGKNLLKNLDPMNTETSKRSAP